MSVYGPAEVSEVVHILAVIPAISCLAERSFRALRRLKTYLRSTMGPKRVSNIALEYMNLHIFTCKIALINIERAYSNSVVNNDMDRNGRESYFF